jgi:biotin-dependent carboxylase-like uncharacterized protein
MTACLKVVAPGLQTTVQDAGRRGRQDVGVPVAGALDRVSLALANALVGNAAGAAALEILLHGPTLEVVAASARVALVGGSGGLDILDEDGRTVPSGESVRLTQGTRFRVNALGDVASACLAVEGGIAVPALLGSASTHVRSGLGGLEGRALLPGDVLPGAIEAVEARPERELAARPETGFEQPIRVVLGPQDDYFTQEAVATFLSAEYRISQQADRMGFRLEGPELPHAKGYDIVSDAIVAGSIQVPGSRRPIVLLVDAQTTGGYPKIATVISADIPVLGRRRSGGTVRFSAVSQAEAEALRREQESTLREMIEAIREVRRGGFINTAALYETNLIDGMVDALA